MVDGEEGLALHRVPGEGLGRVEAVLGHIDVEPTRVRGPGVVGEVDARARREMSERPVAAGRIETGEVGVAAAAQLAVRHEASSAACPVGAQHREPVVERRGTAYLLRVLAGGVDRFDLTGVGQPVLPAQERATAGFHGGAVSLGLAAGRDDQAQGGDGGQQGEEDEEEGPGAQPRPRVWRDHDRLHGNESAFRVRTVRAWGALRMRVWGREVGASRTRARQVPVRRTRADVGALPLHLWRKVAPYGPLVNGRVRHCCETSAVSGGAATSGGAGAEAPCRSRCRWVCGPRSADAAASGPRHWSRRRASRTRTATDSRPRSR